MKLLETPSNTRPSTTRLSVRGRLLSGTVIPVVLGVGLAMAAAPTTAKSPLPTAVKKADSAAPAKQRTSGQRTALPKAVARPVQLAACGAYGTKKGCGACGAKKGCGACGAKKGCGACGAAKKGCGVCGACGACGGAGQVSASCVIPRLAKVNPCAAKKACGACGAKKGCGACGAAKKGCGACGACGACGGKPAIKVSNAEAAAAYECLLKELQMAYAKSGNRIARSYAKWKRYNTVSFVSATHGNRLVNNYGNRAARQYINYDKVKRLPVGSVLAKDSFQIQAGGKLAYGPLFVMEKMARGWFTASGDWKYTMIMPDGTVFGTTRGKGAAKVKFCYECHIAAAEKDSLMFLPEEYRVAK